jgi:hypothetical protein
MSEQQIDLLPVASEKRLNEEEIQNALATLATNRRQQIDRFVLAALSSIPWVGGVLGASAALDAEAEQGRVNALHKQWLEEHKRKLGELAEDLQEVIERIGRLGTTAEVRLESELYLGIVRKGFRVWDSADTREKREYIRRLVGNSAGTTICSDDVVRLFIEWIEYYHEVHFAVIRDVYKNPTATRAATWERLYGGRVREDSAEADLFRLVVHDLSTGRVIRQHREKTADGEFIRKTKQYVPKGNASRTMKSSFDDIEEYELTELGGQFVHYVMTDIVPRIG